MSSNSVIKFKNECVTKWGDVYLMEVGLLKILYLTLCQVSF